MAVITLTKEDVARFVAFASKMSEADEIVIKSSDIGAFAPKIKFEARFRDNGDDEKPKPQLLTE